MFAGPINYNGGRSEIVSADQIKLLCFVPEFLGQNGNDVLSLDFFKNKFKTFFCFDLYVFGLNRNIPVFLRQFLDQIKLFCCVPALLGQNINDLLEIKKCFGPNQKSA